MRTQQGAAIPPVLLLWPTRRQVEDCIWQESTRDVLCFNVNLSEASGTKFFPQALLARYEPNPTWPLTGRCVAHSKIWLPYPPAPAPRTSSSPASPVFSLSKCRDWVCVTSANFSYSAWGGSTKDWLICNNYEAGAVLPPVWEVVLPTSVAQRLEEELSRTDTPQQASGGMKKRRTLVEEKDEEDEAEEDEQEDDKEEDEEEETEEEKEEEKEEEEEEEEEGLR